VKVLAPLAVILAILFASLALDPPLRDAEFTFVNRDEVFTLDPQRMSWMQDFRLAYGLYEPLVRWNNDDFSFEPAACKSLPEVSDDGLTYTFHLRPDARWSNGAPVTAHDYVYSWMRALLPDTAADYTQMFFCIRGGEQFFTWRSARLVEFANRKSEISDSQISGSESLWNETEQHFKSSVGLRASDDLTLEVTLERPTPYFLDLVAFGVFHPVYRPCVEGWVIDDEAIHQQMIERGWHTVDPPPFASRRFATMNDTSGALEQKHEWTKPDELICNGPYVLTEWRYKRGMRLEINPHYHSPEIVQSPAVSIVSISDPNTSALAFERGDIDWLSDVSTDYQPDLLAERARYEQRYRTEIETHLAQGLSIDEALARLPEPEAGERRNIHVFPTFGTDFYSFNCREKLADGRANPFHDARVRCAFVQSVDREVITTRVTRLNEPVVTTFVPRGSIPGYESPEGLGFDPDAARARLAEAGWIDRNGDGMPENEAGAPFPVIDLLYSTNTPRYKNISLALRDMWQRELGVQVELRGKENKSFKEDLISGNFMIGRGRWYGDYGDPTTFLDICKTGDGNNDRGYSHPYVDELLNQAADESDPEKRMATLSECERFLFAEEVPMLVICQLVQLYMYEPGRETGVTGLSNHPRLTQYVWRMKRGAQE